MDKYHAKQSEKKEIKGKVRNLPTRSTFEKTNTNAQAEECSK